MYHLRRYYLFAPQRKRFGRPCRGKTGCMSGLKGYCEVVVPEIHDLESPSLSLWSYILILKEWYLDKTRRLFFWIDGILAQGLAKRPVSWRDPLENQSTQTDIFSDFICVPRSHRLLASVMSKLVSRNLPSQPFSQGLRSLCSTSYSTNVSLNKF